MGRAYIPAAAAPTPDKARSHAVSKHGGGVRRGGGGWALGPALGGLQGPPVLEISTTRVLAQNHWRRGQEAGRGFVSRR